MYRYHGFYVNLLRPHPKTEVPPPGLQLFSFHAACVTPPAIRSTSPNVNLSKRCNVNDKYAVRGGTLPNLAYTHDS